MSQPDYPTIIRQLQEQIVILSAQIGERGAGAGAGTANMDVAKLQLFDRTSSKISGFITGYKLYLRNKMAGAMVEEQIQWILSYVQGGSVDIWKQWR